MSHKIKKMPEEFTQEEKFHLELTMIVCSWNSQEISGHNAMHKVEDLNIKHINGEEI